MKKVLSTAAAFGLVLGVAATASAVDLSVSGSYQLVGAYLSEGTGDATLAASRAIVSSAENPATVTSNQTASDSFWFNTFKMFPTMKVNDSVTMKGEVRIGDRSIWGLQEVTTPQTASSARAVDFNKLWMEYNSPVGMIKVGRIESGKWGTDFMDNNTPGNRIYWYPSAIPKPFEVLLITQKATEADATQAVGADNDNNMYYGHIAHTGDIGKTILAYRYDRNATTGSTGNGIAALDQTTILAYGKYKVQDIGIEGELLLDGGDATATQDRSTFALYLDATGKLGDINAGLSYFNVSGDANMVTGGQDNAYGANGVGADFSPFMILTGDWLGILQADKSAVNAQTFVANTFSSGVSAALIHASMPVSPKMSVNGTIGTAWANATRYAGQATGFGWELDLGASYKLLDNLSYGLHFGYLATGDFFKTSANNTHNQTLNNLYMIANSLTMNF